MYMTETQYDRTKVLIEELILLRANTDKPKFKMASWMSDQLIRLETKLGLHKEIMKAVENPCGTACCLAGKAGLIPKIRRMGFKWDVRPGPIDQKRYSWSSQPWAIAVFQYDGNVGTDAVRAFFGSHVFERVFMNTAKIRTLLQGINALKDAVTYYEENQEWLKLNA